MRIPKVIKEMPWPPNYEGGKQDFKVLISWPVADHERLLVATFMKNVKKNAGYATSSFRLVCSKKNLTARILYAHSSTAKRMQLSEAVRNFGTYIEYCYPEIDPKDEAALGKWLNVRPAETRNHLMPELNEWVSEALARETQKIRDIRGEIRDEDVDLCPDELPTGLINAIRTQLLPTDDILLYKKRKCQGNVLPLRRKGTC